MYVYLVKSLHIRYLNKKVKSLANLMRNSGINQPCSYDNFVTHKHKTEIKAAHKYTSKDNSHKLYQFFDSSFNYIFIKIIIDFSKRSL